MPTAGHAQVGPSGAQEGLSGEETFSYCSDVYGIFPQQEVMSMDEESTSCYGLLEAERCHLLLGRPGRYALVGRPLSQAAAKRLRLAVFGGPDLSNLLGYNLRVYCVDDTPHSLQTMLSSKLGRYLMQEVL
ncbi:unnamed protein product [Boreogadus saida]